MRPLDRLRSIKVKLGVVIVATVGGTVAVLALGRRAGLDLEWRVLLAAALGLAMVQFLARGMTSPLREMAAAATRTWIVDAGRCRPKGNSGSATGPFGRCRSSAGRQLRGVVGVVESVI